MNELAMTPYEPSSTSELRSLRGRLEANGESFPVSVSLASGISLAVRFGPEQIPPDRTEFAKLRVQVPDGELELSRCRLYVERLQNAATGRLVFLDDVYDCKTLIAKGRLVNVRASFESVPLVMAQKESIRPAFQEYVADLAFDLAGYKRFLDEQDRRIGAEPPNVAEAAHRTLLEYVRPSFFRFFDNRLSELEQLVLHFDKEEHARHGFYLRRVLWEFILASEFLRRTNLKPRGYAGDADMMLMTYKNEYVGPRVFSQLLHKHPLETPAAEAVRSRRGLIADALRAAAARHEKTPLRFMSVAAGPAWELRDIFLGAEDCERYQCVLLDQDPYAIACAGQTVGELAGRFGRPLQVDYVNESVRTMLRQSALRERLGQFQFIYSMGLFDYLTPPVARAVLTKLYDLLAPGGALVVGNFHVTNPTRIYMAYWMDWVLYHRTEQELLQLADGLPAASVKLGFDPTGCQMFLHLEKPW